MSEPTCRGCYAASLTSDERQRFYAEPVTTCIYLCPVHQAAEDALLAKYVGLIVRRDDRPIRFPGGI